MKSFQDLGSVCLAVLTDIWEASYLSPYCSAPRSAGQEGGIKIIHALNILILCISLDRISVYILVSLAIVPGGHQFLLPCNLKSDESSCFPVVPCCKQGTVDLARIHLPIQGRLLVPLVHNSTLCIFFTCSTDRKPETFSPNCVTLPSIISFHSCWCTDSTYDRSFTNIWSNDGSKKSESPRTYDCRIPVVMWLWSRHSATNSSCSVLQSRDHYLWFSQSASNKQSQWERLIEGCKLWSCDISLNHRII